MLYEKFTCRVDEADSMALILLESALSPPRTLQIDLEMFDHSFSVTDRFQVLLPASYWPSLADAIESDDQVSLRVNEIGVEFELHPADDLLYSIQAYTVESGTCVAHEGGVHVNQAGREILVDFLHRCIAAGKTPVASCIQAPAFGLG